MNGEMHRPCNKAEVERACQDVLTNLRGTVFDLKENLTGIEAVKKLRKISGKNACDCKNFTPYQSLSLLLKVQGSELPLDYDVGISIINKLNVVGYEKRCQAALVQMMKQSYKEAPSENKTMFLEKIWEYSGLVDFSMDVIEELVLLSSSHLEEDVFSVFEECFKEDNLPECVWMIPRFERLVLWSSKSAKVFCTVTSIINSYLQLIANVTEQFALSIGVVKKFIDKVKDNCVELRRDFVLLYPSECHRLVSILDISPDMYRANSESILSVTRQTVVQLLMQNLKDHPVRTLCVLTHFPEWVSYINT